MIISGFQKVTLIDYPAEIASTVFTFGCNLRCPFCHNPELVLPESGIEKIDEQEILSYLNKRKKLLSGVCITGGEPLMQKDIKYFIEKIHDLGLKVKLDTNGTFPEHLKTLKVDYIAMDIKTTFEKYHLMGYTGSKNLTELLKESIDYIINSNIDYEFRTTLIPNLLTIEEIPQIIEMIKGAKKYYLDQFRPKNLLNKDWEKIIPYQKEIFETIKNKMIENGIDCELRYF